MDRDGGEVSGVELRKRKSEGRRTAAVGGLGLRALTSPPVSGPGERLPDVHVSRAFCLDERCGLPGRPAWIRVTD